MTISVVIESMRPSEGRGSPDDIVNEGWLLDDLFRRSIGGFGSRGSKLFALRFILTIHMLLRDRHCIEALFFDQIAANNAYSVCTSSDTLKRFVELFDIITRALSLKEMFFTLHGIRSLFGSMQSEGLILSVELTGSIHQLLGDNIEFLACLSALL